MIELMNVVKAYLTLTSIKKQKQKKHKQTVYFQIKSINMITMINYKTEDF